MRRLHRNKMARCRCDEPGHDHDEHIEQPTAEEQRAAAIAKIEADRVAALSALGVIANEIKHD